MALSLQLFPAPHLRGTVQHLPSSKSLSNRALILQALAGPGTTLTNLSPARDTTLMMQLIGSSDTVIDVMDAGTTMRFLTAYFAITGKSKILTGTARMQQRPIAPLVDALRLVGVTITYEKSEGYPPVHIRGFNRQQASTVTLPGNLSSQYISALLMVAPLLPEGLTVTLAGKIGSAPYIRMTLALMAHFGIEADFQGHTLRVPPGKYQPTHYRVEADWSAASYWYAFTALAPQADIYLPGVIADSWQGDKAIVQMMEPLGVATTFYTGGARLSKQHHLPTISWDFTDCPDLAQTILPVCAAKGITGTFNGLESLRIKETDRLAALQTELAKLGTDLTETSSGIWHLSPGVKPHAEKLVFDTYHDHRMAMGLAPLALLQPITIREPDVVQKSYPQFWQDVAGVGLPISNQGS